MSKRPTRKKRNGGRRKTPRDVGMGPPPLRASHARFVNAIRGGATNIDAARIAGFSGPDRQLAVRASELLAREDVHAALNATVKEPKVLDPKETVMKVMIQTAAAVDEYGLPVKVPLREKLAAAKMLGTHLGMFRERDDLQPGFGDIPDWVPFLPDDTTMETYEAWCAEYRARKLKAFEEEQKPKPPPPATEAEAADRKLNDALARGWKDDDAV